MFSAKRLALLGVVVGVAFAACSDDAQDNTTSTTSTATQAQGSGGAAAGGMTGAGANGGDTTATSGGGAPASDWLHTEGNHILRGDGTIWRGRGANVHDTRSCNACTYEEPNVAEVLRRVDALVDDWGANFVRLNLESYATGQPYQQHWESLVDDPAYLQDVVTMVDHIGSKDDTYVLLSLWVDPTQDGMGWPTNATNATWQLLAETFIDDPHVIFGIINEPEYNFDGALDDQVWQRMNDAVAAIREVEDAMGAERHVIAVQGTGGWARRLDYYVDHPITAGNGENVAYEIHIYNPASDFDMMLQPALTLPVIIGEHGPSDVGNMSLTDCGVLADLAQQRDIPYLAWTFHQRCPPNLIQELAPGCGVDMPIVATPWGEQFKTQLATPW